MAGEWVSYELSGLHTPLINSVAVQNRKGVLWQSWALDSGSPPLYNSYKQSVKAVLMSEAVPASTRIQQLEKLLAAYKKTIKVKWHAFGGEGSSTFLPLIFLLLSHPRLELTHTQIPTHSEYKQKIVNELEALKNSPDELCCSLSFQKCTLLIICKLGYNQGPFQIML